MDKIVVLVFNETKCYVEIVMQILLSTVVNKIYSQITQPLSQFGH